MTQKRKLAIATRICLMAVKPQTLQELVRRAKRVQTNAQPPEK